MADTEWPPSRISRLGGGGDVRPRGPAGGAGGVACYGQSFPTPTSEQRLAQGSAVPTRKRIG